VTVPSIVFPSSPTTRAPDLALPPPLLLFYNTRCLVSPFRCWFPFLRTRVYDWHPFRETPPVCLAIACPRTSPQHYCLEPLPPFLFPPAFALDLAIHPLSPLLISEQGSDYIITPPGNFLQTAPLTCPGRWAFLVSRLRNESSSFQIPQIQTPSTLLRVHTTLLSCPGTFFGNSLGVSSRSVPTRSTWHTPRVFPATCAPLHAPPASPSRARSAFLAASSPSVPEMLV